MAISKIVMCPTGPSVSRLAMGVWRIGDYDIKDAKLVTFIEQL